MQKIKLLCDTCSHYWTRKFPQSLAWASHILVVAGSMFIKTCWSILNQLQTLPGRTPTKLWHTAISGKYLRNFLLLPATQKIQGIWCKEGTNHQTLRLLLPIITKPNTLCTVNWCKIFYLCCAGDKMIIFSLSYKWPTLTETNLIRKKDYFILY